MQIIEITNAGHITRVFVGVAAMDEERETEASLMAQSATGLDLLDVVAHYEDSVFEIVLERA